jgi:ATP-dependent DNA helicase RecG
MEALELFSLLARGEDSIRQFKKNITNSDALAAEFVAFSNGAGGRIFIGVNDDGSVAGLTSDDVRRLNQLVSNTASQSVEPAINPITSNKERIGYTEYSV